MSRDQPSDPLALTGTQLQHYRIDAFLGGGGMGVVYRAQDTRLERPVALKFLPTLQSQDEDARKRFFVEARAASALDHPNICTVYEIGETDDGQVFIAMAYYAGETLKHKIARGALPLGVALDYALQIARGLARAHADGIIHRDVKPANVLVTDEGTAKLLDFGTAKVGDLDLTRTGGVVGTLRYMSPEQAEGEPTDARTDIWSLGALLYEMLAGAPAFGGESAPSVIYAMMVGQPVPLREHKVSVPPSVQALIEKCLEKNRDDRYASAEALEEELERVAGDSGVMAAILRPTRPTSRAARSNRLALGVTAAAVLAGLTLTVPAVRNGVRGLLGGAGGSGRQYVAVLPFTSSSPDDEVMAAGLTHSFTSMISGLGTEADSLWVVPSSEIAGNDIRTASQARQFFPVNSVLEGNLSRVQDTQEFVLNLVDAQPEVPTLISSTVLPSPTDSAFQSRARASLSDMLGVTRSGGQTANPRAYPYYLRAQGYLQRLFDPASLATAVELFSQAVAEDPEFALAHAGLCETLWEQFRDTSDRSLSDRAIASCDRAAELAGDDPSVLTTLGSLYLQTGQHTKAEETLLAALEREPDDAESYRWLARVYEADANYDQASIAYRRAIELRPDIWIYREDFAVMAVLIGRLDEARDQFEQVTRLSPDNYLGYNGLGMVALFQGELAEAKRHFRFGVARQESAIAYRNLAYIAIREHDYPQAVTEAQRSIAIQEADWFSWHRLGLAHYLLGETEEASLALQRVIDLAGTRLEVNPRDVDALILLAESHALLGDEVQARQHLERASNETIPYPHQFHNLARAYELVGERALALGAVEGALEGDFHPSAIDQDPVLDELRTDPDFAPLRNRFTPLPN